MRRIIGPVLTTGVALVTAGVVVANPITAPRADVQIPAVQLSSGNDETGGMLDPAFLEAIALAPPESDNPFAVLKRLITSFASDATSVGRNAILDAFVAGIGAVSQPDLTAASVPYTPRVDHPVLTQALVPGFDITTLVPDAPVTLPEVTFTEATTYIANSVTPVVSDLVTGLVADVGYVGNGLVEAAFAVGAMVAAEPGLIVDTLGALVNGDFDGAIQTAIKALVAPIGPPIMLLQMIRNVIANRLNHTPGSTPTPSSQFVPPRPVTDPALSGVNVAEAPAPSIWERTRHGDVPRTASVPAAAALSNRAAVLGAATARPQAAATIAPRKAAAAARDAIKAIGEQAGAAVADAAETVGKVAGRPGTARAAAAGHRG